MTLNRWIQSPRARRGLAAGIIVLSVGGLVLSRSSHVGAGPVPAHPIATGVNAVNLSGPGLHGTFALSHSTLLAGTEQRVFAELRLRADEQPHATQRAPLALVVLLDTSGSMEGSKIQEAKDSVVRLIQQMDDNDEIALVRYASDTERLQSLTRVGDVREALIDKVRRVQAGGGTDIPPALSAGVDELSLASHGRVKRVVLVSDGLDSGQPRAETLARDAAESGVTLSSLGIGLDFDEDYLSSVARLGRGNFGFVKDAPALARFLERELNEASTTTTRDAMVRLSLPAGLRFVQAVGADAKVTDDGRAVRLAVGSLFAGDERRVLVELTGQADLGDSLGLAAEVGWTPVGGEAQTRTATLTLHTSSSPERVAEGRDGAVLARAVGAIASLRQLEAARAYRNGEGARAQGLIDDNLRALDEAAAAAPPEVAITLQAQRDQYRDTKGRFDGAQPGSAAGKAAAKESAAQDSANLGRSAY